MEILLASGADIMHKNKQGWTALAIALGTGNFKIAPLLEKKMREVNYGMPAAQQQVSPTPKIKP